jgi:hypothetical protein
MNLIAAAAQLVAPVPCRTNISAATFVIAFTSDWTVKSDRTGDLVEVAVPAYRHQSPDSIRRQAPRGSRGPTLPSDADGLRS